MDMHNARESVQMAMETLRKNKLRSGLTILGIAIGISTVILISSAINGLNTNINSFIATLGSNTLWIFQYEFFAGRPTTEMLNRKKLTVEDAMALRELPHVVTVDARQSSQNFQTGISPVSIKVGSRSIQNTSLIGSTTAFKDVMDVKVTEGRMWNDAEQERFPDIVVLGHDSAEDLFPDGSPVGQDVDVEGHIMTVIGVLDRFPAPFGTGRNPNDNAALFPITTFHKIHPEIKDVFVQVKYDDPSNKSLVIEEVRERLRIRRKVRADQDDNFAIFGPDSLTRLWNQLTGGLFLFMVAVSSVGLMVGGVGVMNIMLVSVTERTREIGIRKAIGATRKNILLQFTLEAVTLCAVGGMLGIAAGSLFTLILHFAVSFLHAAVSTTWVLIAFAVACVIGLVFGIYPAWKAANLDPIEALRYE